ncbi:MAG: squalene synthase HpnC, partial [Phycisphaeraceae bacterium]|nr:squalene synthase HpnC [Phycisphaeraceae bacterium]
FTVVSWFLPRRLRDDFRHVYSFCRWADDLGDETGDPERSLELLGWWREELDRCYEGEPRHPVFVALAPVIERREIPRDPFDHLIDAFEQDQRVTRYDTWEQTVDYCTRSADPVGRLVLYICGYRDEARQRLSDATCTALQLANFWQDVRRDVLERDRVYIPREVADAHGLDIATMVSAIRADASAPADGSSCAADRPSAGIKAIQPAYRATMEELVGRTWPLFEQGRELLPKVAADVRMDIRLFTMGGEAVLRAIERQRFDTLRHRPTVGKAAKLWLMSRALMHRWLLPWA